MEQAHSVGRRSAPPAAFACDGSTTLERLRRLHVAMDVAKAVMRTVSIDLIRPGTSLRRQFPENEIDELAASIREKGMLQPVLVRPRGEAFELIAGERRWRAAQRAGLHEIPPTGSWRHQCPTQPCAYPLRGAKPRYRWWCRHALRTLPPAAHTAAKTSLPHPRGLRATW